MPLICTCPQGHRWKHSGGEPPYVCPSCGSGAASVNEETGPDAHAETMSFTPGALTPGKLANPPPQAAVPTARSADLPPRPPTPTVRPPEPPVTLPRPFGGAAGIQTPGAPVPPRPNPPPPRSPSPPEENRTRSWLNTPAPLDPPRPGSGRLVLTAAGTAVACAVLGALAWFLWLGPTAEAEREQAERAAAEAKQQADDHQDKLKKVAKDLEDEQKAHARSKDDLKDEREERDKVDARLTQAEGQARKWESLAKSADQKFRQIQAGVQKLNQATFTEKRRAATLQAQLDRAQAEAHADRVNLAAAELNANAPDRAADALARCTPEQRGWEWRYLHDRCGAEVYAFRPHAGLTTSLAYRPDGKRLATAGTDKTVSVWDPRTGKLFLTCKGHTRPVLAVAFSRDGKRLASADGDAENQGEVKVWDAESGKELHSFPGPAAQAVAFGLEGRLAAGGADGTVRLWDGAGKGPRELKGLQKAVRALAFSPDGNLLAAGDGDLTGLPRKMLPGEVKLWDVKEGKELQSLKDHAGPVLGLAFRPDGKQLLTSDAAGLLRVWDAAAPKATVLKTLPLGGLPVRALAVTPDGKRLFAGGGDGLLYVVHLETAAVERRYLADPRGFIALAVSPDGARVASAEGDQTVRFWEMREYPPFLALGKQDGEIACLTFSPDGRLVACAGADPVVRLWDVRTRRAVRPLEGLTRPAAQLLFSPDGKRVVAVGRPAEADQAIEVHIWDTATGKKVGEIPGRSGAVAYAGFGPDSKRLLLASPGKGLLIWDLAEGKGVERLDGLPNSPQAGAEVDCLAASADGRYLALAGRAGGNVAQLVQGAAGEEWRTVQRFKPLPTLTGMAWGGKGRVALSLQGNLWVYDVSGPMTRGVGSWKLAQPDPRRVAISADGQRLFGGVGSPALNVWQPLGPGVNRLLLNLPGPGSALTCVAYSPDGRRIVAGCADGALVLWDAAPRSEEAAVP